METCAYPLLHHGVLSLTGLHRRARHDRHDSVSLVVVSLNKLIFQGKFTHELDALASFSSIIHILTAKTAGTVVNLLRENGTKITS